MLSLEGLIYFLAIFVIEYMSKIGSIYRFFTKEDSVPYVPKKYKNFTFYLEKFYLYKSWLIKIFIFLFFQKDMTMM